MPQGKSTLTGLCESMGDSTMQEELQAWEVPAAWVEKGLTDSREMEGSGWDNVAKTEGEGWGMLSHNGKQKGEG